MSYDKIKFVEYYVDDFDYNVNHNRIKTKIKTKPTLPMTFSLDLKNGKNANKGLILFSITCNVSNKTFNDNTTALYLNTTLHGVFDVSKLTDVEIIDSYEYMCGLLYPYLKGIVAQVTSIFNNKPLQLPVLDMKNLCQECGHSPDQNYTDFFSDLNKKGDSNNEIN